MNGRAIGNIGLLQIDPVHGRAGSASASARRTAGRRGYGTDAIRLLLRYAFENLGLRRIQLITDTDNERGIRCYEKCGFYREALLREHRLRYGKPLDMVQMAVLKTSGRKMEARDWRLERDPRHFQFPTL